MSEERLEQRFDALKTLLATWSRETLAVAKPFTYRDDSQNMRLYLKLVGEIVSKWSIEILAVLLTRKTLGFVELRKSLKGISSRVLSGKLKMLETRGLVARRVLNTRPPRARYTLTEKGLSLVTLGTPVILYLRFKEGLYGPQQLVRRGHNEPKNNQLSSGLQQSSPGLRA